MAKLASAIAAPPPMPTEDPIITVEKLSKTYASGLAALKGVDLTISRGEIFALLGPNGAGKTTLIGVICGLVNPTSGRVIADGHDVVLEARAARSKIGLVPQELSTDMFETVHDTVTFSRGLFGKPKDPAHIERVLRELSLWEKRDSKIMALSGGMKRRVLIAKALSHEPRILFLDEPTAGVDVELRREMWRQLLALRASGVTIVLTTHYIEEAEQLADRIGVINHGEIVLVEEKEALMDKLGKRQITLILRRPIERTPERLGAFDLELASDGLHLVYTYSSEGGDTKVGALLREVGEAGLDLVDLRTRKSSLEEIFVSLVTQEP